MTFQFKIQLEAVTSPSVWRQISVPADFTFSRFHRVIQAAFGWEDAHGFEFRDTGKNSSLCIDLTMNSPLFDTESDAESMNASTTTLSDIFNDGFRKLLYIYDPDEDSWIHRITLKSIECGEQQKAVCLSGQGACPPEDFGGPSGYEDIKAIFSTEPDSEEADEYRVGLDLDDGEVWDADLFDIKETNRLLHNMTRDKVPYELIKRIAAEIGKGFVCFINADTLEAESIPEECYTTYPERAPRQVCKDVFDKVDAWESRICIIPPASYMLSIIMENFIEFFIPEGDAWKSRLLKAISRKHPLKNFNLVLTGSPHQQRWFDYKQSWLEEVVMEQLHNGYHEYDLGDDEWGNDEWIEVI